jgi:hypothetical protein
MISRAPIRSLLARHYPDLPIARTLGALAVATTLTFVLTACARDLTDPTVARTKVDNAKPAFNLTGTAAWNGSTVSIESAQPNSSGQTVCLDIPGGVAVANQNVNYYPCHYGPNQRFVLSATDAGFGESWVMVSSQLNPSLCLDIRWGTTNGGEALQLFPCKGFNPGAGNQTFLLPAAIAPGSMPMGQVLVTTVCVMNGYPNLVLDVPLPAGVSGQVQQFKLNHGQNQLWRFKDTSLGANGDYFRTSSTTSWNKC